MEAGTMMLIGTGVQAGAGIAKGYAAQQAGEYNAEALRRAATGEVAGAQRTAAERRTETDRLISKQTAVAAASGAGSGPSLLDIIGDTAQAGEYRAQAEQYAGDQRARALRDRAGIARWQGRNAFVGSILEGVGTVATGAARYDMKYGSTPGSTGYPGTRTSSYGPVYG